MIITRTLRDSIEEAAADAGVTTQDMIIEHLDRIYKRLGDPESKIDVCPDCGAQLPRGEPCPNCSTPSPPVYRLEFTGAGEAVATFTDGDGAGQRNEFCGQLEILMDLLCCSYSGPLTAYTAAHNALGKIIKDALEAFREINGAHQRVVRAEIDADPLPF